MPHVNWTQTVGSDQVPFNLLEIPEYLTWSANTEQWKFKLFFLCGMWRCTIVFQLFLPLAKKEIFSSLNAESMQQPNTADAE